MRLLTRTVASATVALAGMLLSATPLQAGPDKSGVRPQAVSLPKGPGSVRGLGSLPEPTLHSGEASYALRLEIPPGAARHEPELTLRYSSLAGNSPFGIGWGLGLPSIQRQTEKGQPAYTHAD